ncbi:MAG: hypothetical protein KAQ79_02730, partial [Cyclobacteriaceae bacterium]|nr:hypothetical protein [Cyclobacteriaceae bacterium]
DDVGKHNGSVSAFLSRHKVLDQTFMIPFSSKPSKSTSKLSVLGCICNKSIDIQLCTVNDNGKITNPTLPALPSP